MYECKIPRHILRFILRATLFTEFPTENQRIDMSVKYRGAMVGPDSSPESLNALKAKGANVCRYEIVGDINAVGALDENTYYRWVNEHIERAINFLPTIGDMQVIIDLHTPPGGMHKPVGKLPVYSMFDIRPECREWFKNTWQFIAERLKDFPNVLAFDLINEPHGNKKQIFSLMRNTIKRIREHSDKPCIVSCPFSTPENVKNFSIYNQDVLGPVWYTIHMYLPYAVTHQGIPGTGYPAGRTYPNANYDKARLKKDLLPFKNFLPHEVHYIGEFSISAYADEASRVNYLTDLISIFEEWGWDWSFHAWRESPVWDIEAYPAVLAAMEKAWGKNA